VEWSLVNNFKNTGYINRYKECDSGIPRKGQKISLKHSMPNLDNSDYCVVIYKDYSEWSISVRNRQSAHGAKHRGNDIEKRTWRRYMERAKELDPEKTLIVKHIDCVKDYEGFLRQIEEKFGYKLNKDFRQPKYRLGGGGAETVEGSEIYEPLV
tara:strand:+ start:15326 stop:15787 length:462 start_codon:yes stop_codon:yes gene_type:complete